jgi:parallel beta-helix repeat protein
MKRVFSILLALALVLAFSLVATTPVAAATPIYVNGTTGNDTWDGTSATWVSGTIGPKKTIQAGVNVVDAGGTVNVAAGTYNENVVINKTNLTLKSQTALGAIIRPTTSGSNAVYITADGVTVDGFEIDGTTVAKNGILGWETSGLTIKNNKVHGAVNAWDGCGILLFSWGNNGTVYNNLIQDNEVYDTGRMGIMIMDYGPAIYTVTYGNTITGNTVHDVWKVAWGDGGGGIQINVGKNCAITNNLVYDVQNGQRGIYMFGSAVGNTITANTLRDNPIGIQVWISGDQPTPYINWGGETATSPQVHFNNIYNNSSYGAIGTNVQGTTMVLDATCNWWGAANGPSGAGSGSGDVVSGNVTFARWLGAKITDQPTGCTADRDTGASASPSTNSVSATATGGGTNTVVYVAEYVGNPTAVSTGFASGQFFFDVRVDGTVPATLVVDVNSPRTSLVWFDGTKWLSVTPTTRIGGILRATLSNASSPTIAQLAGQPFGLGDPGAVGWETYPISKVRVLLPWIALLAAFILAASLLVLRRRRAQT